MQSIFKKLLVWLVCACLLACTSITTTRIGVDFVPGSNHNVPTRGSYVVHLKSGEALAFTALAAKSEGLEGTAVGSTEVRTIPWSQIESLEREDVDSSKTLLLIGAIAAVVLLAVNSMVNNIGASFAR